jgi:hypothetical protein
VQDRQKIDDQGLQSQMQTWNKYSQQIEGAFNSQLKGLLSGTETFGQAVKNISSQLVMKVIEDLEKWAVEHLGVMLLNTTATQTAATSQAAAQQAASAATLPGRAASFTSAIMADAAVAFAGVFANLAPFLGPGAAGPAAASEAVVMAQLASVPKFDLGTNYILNSGLAMVHQGETIVPAQGSGPFTGGQGGGGQVNVTFQVSSIDANGTQAYFRSNAGQIAQILSDHMNSNPSFKS